MSFKQAIVATMMMLAAAASVDKVVAVSAATTTKQRRVKSSKNDNILFMVPSKKSPKSSKKNSPTPSPVALPTPNSLALPTPAPVLPPLPYRPTDFPTTTAPEPTDGPTEQPLLDIPNTAQEKGYTTLMKALTAADLVDALSFPHTGPFTLFAPTNAAFHLLDEDLLGCLSEPRYQDVLQDVLMYHVADGEYSTEKLVNDQVINMWDGQKMLINIDDGTVVINANDNDNDNAKVVLPNVLASNGILHGIDRVLMPPEFDAADFVAFCLDADPGPTDDLTSIDIGFCFADSCPDGNFCNFYLGDRGECEECPPDSRFCPSGKCEECPPEFDWNPDDAVVDCEKNCSFDVDRGCIADFCPEGTFCNFDDSPMCVGCPSSTCSDNGLPEFGVVDCEKNCSFDAPVDPGDDECKECPP